jgi:Leucine-rich repeat (LRR) protein
MSNNQLSGPLPLFTSTSLKELDLENNLLSGTISNTLGIGLTSMTNFNLNHNHLSGTLPLSIMEMTSLQYLQLSENGLHGTLPATLGRLSNLEYLYLNNNNFVGEIPKDLTPSSTKLAEIWLQDNLLSG